MSDVVRRGSLRALSLYRVYKYSAIFASSMATELSGFEWGYRIPERELSLRWRAALWICTGSGICSRGAKPRFLLLSIRKYRAETSGDPMMPEPPGHCPDVVGFPPSGGPIFNITGRWSDVRQCIVSILLKLSATPLVSAISIVEGLRVTTWGKHVDVEGAMIPKSKPEVAGELGVLRAPDRWEDGHQCFNVLFEGCCWGLGYPLTVLSLSKTVRTDPNGKRAKRLVNVLTASRRACATYYPRKSNENSPFDS
ncbi:hypothetical protein EVAR_98917_1 [Eumeta japonica]|uniref:Uncharacterized protein n=1 Tax=Eumeta variegata TaxID=151549 RepID=A0A4C1Y2F4_EUMVA|nr:hypothetical protein EVAR_98917_1 [Eumeta japonica]